MELLAIAFYLSVLTYYVGVLVKALPVPIYGLKKWGSQLMIDGIFSAILVFSYNAIKWSVEHVGRVLGVNWDSFYSWLLVELNVVSGLIVALKTMGVGLSSAGLSFVANSIISPLVSSLTYLLLFLLTSSILITVLITLSDTILALGLALHAIPFRITRASGSTLIALVIVFSVGAPLMPQFVSLVFSGSAVSSNIAHGYVLANIYVRDYRNSPVPYYLYEIHSVESGELLARYLADERGTVDAADPLKGIPNSTHSATVKLAGYYYRTTVDPGSLGSSRPAQLNVTIKVNNLIVLRPIRFVSIFSYDSVSVYSADDDEVSLRISSRSSSHLVVVGFSTDSIVVHVNGSQRRPNSTITYEWGEERFRAHNYTLPRGVHEVRVSISGSYFGEPSFEEVYYARDTLDIDFNEPTSIAHQIAALIFKLFIAPIVYLAMLFSASMALSKLLGGSAPRIARVLVSGA